MLTRDELLDNVMLYWLPAAGASSARLYWESFRQRDFSAIDVPAGISVFPKEIFRISRRWAETRFSDLRHFGEPAPWRALRRHGAAAAVRGGGARLLQKRPLAVAGGSSSWRSAAASWRPVWSLPAALRAVRAAIVVPGLFAFADQVLDNLQIATFAAFGGFATLVLVSFGGTRREKLTAHLALALAGSALIAIGTAVSSTTALAALVTVPVAFAVFFLGVCGPNAAAGVNGALLAYVLPAASAGTTGMIPERLAGWWLASLAGTAAVILLSPPAGGDRLRPAAAEVADSLAAVIDGALGGTAVEDGLAKAIEAKHALLAAFTATPYRPTGASAPDEALANAIDLLEWCTGLVADMVRERPDLSDAGATERDLLRAPRRPCSRAWRRCCATVASSSTCDRSPRPGAALTRVVRGAVTRAPGLRRRGSHAVPRGHDRAGHAGDRRRHARRGAPSDAGLARAWSRAGVHGRRRGGGTCAAGGSPPSAGSRSATRASARCG